jgi:putative spermidine/putrescine transport system ATP-binding protein
MATLQIKNLHKSFGETTVLEDVNLDIASGELVSLLGPSGSGKTTVLRIIAGFEQAEAGDVLVEGKDVSHVPANKRNMGMVFQAYSLFPNMTARDNVAFGLRIRKIDRAKRRARAEEILALMGLTAAGDRYPHQLSGGMQQRVALARALVIEPAVLLLDEPLSALDAKVRVQLRVEIRRIQTQLGITTVYVTHDQEEALSISDRVAVMSDGRLQQVGAPADVYRSPQTAFVAEFVGTMNRIDGVVTDDGSVKVGTNGIRLKVGQAHDRPVDEPVVALIRPESISLAEMSADDAPHEPTIIGHVQGRTFLGAITRMTLETSIGPLIADVSSIQALTLELESKVAVHVDANGVRLLSR